MFPETIELTVKQSHVDVAHQHRKEGVPSAECCPLRQAAMEAGYLGYIGLNRTMKDNRPHEGYVLAIYDDEESARYFVDEAGNEIARFFDSTHLKIIIGETKVTLTRRIV